MKIHTAVAFLLVLGVVSLAAAAKPAGYGTGKDRFMAFFDSNGDNLVTMDELKAASKTRFDKMDADASGAVTHEEFVAYVSERRQQRREQRFAFMDSNGDGQVSKDEYIAYKSQRAAQRFERMDANQDNMMSAQEYGEHKRGHHHRKHRHHGGKDGRQGFFYKLDANNDGELTLEESLAAWTNWFKRIDADNDQVVTAEEVKNYRRNKHSW
jgi:Ca2+-binding EF-hand superfamily protein